MAAAEPPVRLYLDQKDWISLARVRLQKADRAERRAAAALAKGFGTGRLIVPFSESHVLETGARAQPSKRLDVAMTIMLLSKRHALAPVHQVWVQEADAFLARRFGAPVAGEPEPFGKGVAFALGIPEDKLTLPWAADASEAEVAMVEMYAIAEPGRAGLSGYDIERQARWDALVDTITSTSKHLVKDRERYNEHEQDRLAAVTLTMLGNELIGRAIGYDVHDAYLDLLREEGPWAVIREIPSLAVMTELLRVRYPDVQAPWTTHDYHDVRFLSTALAYCDAVCPDRRWGELALRSEHIAIARSSSRRAGMRCRRRSRGCSGDSDGRGRPREGHAQGLT
jgi:hypothetical protein